jgi:hypothetical protein
MSRAAKIILGILLIPALASLAVAINMAVNGREEITNVQNSIETMGVIVVFGGIAAFFLLIAWMLVVVHFPARLRKRAAITTVLVLCGGVGLFGISIVWDILRNVMKTDTTPPRAVAAEEIEREFQAIAAILPASGQIAERPCADDAIWSNAPIPETHSWFGQNMVWALAVSQGFLSEHDARDEETHANIRRAFFGDQTEYWRRYLHDQRYLAITRADAVFIVDTSKASVVCQVPVANKDLRRSMRRISRVVRVSL